MQENGAPFGVLLRRYRQSAALSQADLAKRAGMSLAAISTLERGRRATPRPDTLQLLATALKLTSEQRAAFVASIYFQPRPATLGSDKADPTSVEANPGRSAPPKVIGPGGDPSPRLPRPAPLPTPPTQLLGREREEAEIVHLMRQSMVRLLTLTGPGGVGKTRLALQVADDLATSFPDGVCWVSLAEIHDPALIGSTILHALGGTEIAQADVQGTLVAALQGRKMLLVLDNCEQLLAEVTIVAALLSACPGLTIMTTSRAPLRLRGEQEFAVAPLAVPRPGEGESAEHLLQYSAIGLFVQRATAIKPTFVLTDGIAGSIAELCRRLDGLPLALELAAAKVKVLGIEALLGRLSDRLALLTGGARDLPPRQQTLRAAIAWSDDLLDERTRRLFRRLSVFVGGCTLAAVEAVCAEGGDGDILADLTVLVDHSLLQSVEDAASADGPRFMLLETIREYAISQLETRGESAIRRDRHLTWCRQLAEQAESALTGPDLGLWLTRLENEHDNLRAALNWSLAAAADAADRRHGGLALAGALWRFWWVRGYLHEGRRWLEATLQSAGDAPSALRARALSGAGNLAGVQHDFERARHFYEECLTIYEELGDARGLAATLVSMGRNAHYQGDHEQAASRLRRGLALWRELGDKRGIAIALGNLATLVWDQEDYTGARLLREESLTLFREIGDLRSVAYALGSLARVVRSQGEIAQAEALWLGSLGRFVELGVREEICRCLEGLAGISLTGDVDRIVDARSAERAVLLFGGAAILRESTGARLLEADRVSREREIAGARQVLGDGAFETAWRRGRALNQDRLVALALDIDAGAGAVPGNPN